jgi:hypothetical protein
MTRSPGVYEDATVSGSPRSMSDKHSTTTSNVPANTANKSPLRSTSRSASTTISPDPSGAGPPNSPTNATSTTPGNKQDSGAGTAGLSPTSESTPVPSANSTRAVPAAAPTPQAPSQESFFKSISKRLQQLESNSTLSLLYIEEQSRILRDAFSAVEKRQISATTNFLSTLNSTVMTELHGFRQAYDQLWQSTVIELEGHREQYRREMLALSSRLTMVADELVWQKRMGTVQSTLLLLCLGLVLFGRQGNSGLDMTLAQQIMIRSQAALKTNWESEPGSPSSPASRSPVAMFRRRIWRSSTEPVSRAGSEGACSRPQTSDGLVPGVEIEPPTPRAYSSQRADYMGTPAHAEESDDELQPEEVSDEMTRPRSSSAVPDVNGSGLKQLPSDIRWERA